MAQHHHPRGRREDRLRGAAPVRRRRVADHPRRHVRGARRRLARPRRALADHRGRVRRPAQGRRRRQDQDRRRRDRPGGEPRRMNREIVVTGVGAVTPLGIGARTLYERWRAGDSGIQDGVGAATEFDPTEHLSIKQARRADRFSQFAMVASDEALAEAGWAEELPYDADARRDADRHRHRRHRDARGEPQAAAREGPEGGLTAVDPAAHGQRGLGGRVDAPRPARPVVRHAVRLRGGRARDRHRLPHDPVRRRRRGRDRRLGGRAHAARHRRVRARSTRSATSASRVRSTPSATGS